MVAAYPACQPELEPFDIAMAGGKAAAAAAAAAAMDAPAGGHCPPLELLAARRHADFDVNVTLEPPSADGRVEYVAAAPPDHRAAFGGSALPFASPRHAFENTPNAGVAQAEAGGRALRLQLQFPNSYYAGLGTTCVPPTVYLRYTAPGGQPVRASVKLSHGIPYRALAHPPARTGPEFYNNVHNLPVRTQEQILLDSAYPATNAEAPNFWGLKPSV